MPQYEYKCGSCGCVSHIYRPMHDGPVPSFACPCGKANMNRVWSPPQTIVKGFRGDHQPRLPGINLAAYKRSNEAQQQLYTKIINHKKYRDTREKGARGTSRHKQLFRRTGSIPRELLVAEARSNGIAAGKLLKEHGNDLYKRYGCDWTPGVTKT